MTSYTWRDLALVENDVLPVKRVSRPVLRTRGPRYGRFPTGADPQATVAVIADGAAAAVTARVA
jgi:hypothetical protein